MPDSELEPHTTMGRDQHSEIYWDDVSVLLTGTLDPAYLHQLLSGPPLCMEVHDRDRILEKQKLKPALFGDDLEDEKISNVGTVSSKLITKYLTNSITQLHKKLFVNLLSTLLIVTHLCNAKKERADIYIHI